MKYFKGTDKDDERFMKKMKSNVATSNLYELFGNSDLVVKSLFCEIKCTNGKILK